MFLLLDIIKLCTVSINYISSYLHHEITIAKARKVIKMMFKKVTVLSWVLITCIALSACSQFRVMMTPSGFNVSTNYYKYVFERFDQNDPSMVRFQVTVEPTTIDNAIALPPVSVDVQPTVSKGKQITIVYFDPGSRSLSDFQVGLNGGSYTGKNYRVDIRYFREETSTKVIITVDPISPEALLLPPITVEYKPTQTGGLVVLVGWSPKEVPATAKIPMKKFKTKAVK